jgi:pyruvate,orthophosphate dikinase
MSQKWVYLFKEVDKAEKEAGSWEGVRGLLGGKGANLGEMSRLDIPVPPGFTVTTEACNAYLAAGEKFPEGMWEQELDALKAVEKQTGKKFGDPKNPLLVSCRSGAKFSMPGMMDTVLNIGLNDETAKGMIELTGDERFVYDSYRRLVQMFGTVVMGVPDEPFEEVISEFRKKRGVSSDAGLTAEDWKEITEKFKEIVKKHTGNDFPTDPVEQLRLATEAVFKSWNGKRAIDYRNAAGISHELGTGVSIQTMVFGNMGNDSATGVATSRNISTGENEIEGDYLTNAQGEDVVAGIRLTKPIQELKEEMPESFEKFEEINKKLEKHYREVQDVEFTIENGNLWMLQTRDSKRTAQAAVRIAADLVEEGLISKEEAVLRISPDQVDFFLHPQFDAKAKKEAVEAARLLAMGLNVSPGAAVGQVALDADLAEKWAKHDGRKVIMVRPETKPDDVHGMLAAEGILTSRGGRTSHAALVARQFGKPAVVGCAELDIDLEKRQISVGELMINEGDWVSLFN